MPTSLSDVVDDLLTRRTQDPGRLNLLATYCIEAFRGSGFTAFVAGKPTKLEFAVLVGRRTGTSRMCLPGNLDSWSR